MSEHEHNHQHTTVVEPVEPTVESPVGDGIAIKPENVEYRIYATLKDDGSVAKRELVQTADFAKWEKEHPKAVQEMVQTVRKYKVGSFEGLAQLIGDDEEVLNIINRGLAAKFSQKINTTLLETNEQNGLVFEPTTSVFDSRELLQEATQRKSLSPLEKLGRDAKKAGFDSDLVAQLLQQLMAAKSN